MSNVRIEQFQLTDEEPLLAFLPQAYPDEPRKSEPDFWRWHFLENPYTSRDDVPLWLAKDDEKIVGQLSAIPVDLKVGNNIINALWMVDLVVLPEYRGQKLGTRLFKAALDMYPTQIALGFNEKSGPILKSFNWVSLGSVHRYHRLLNPGDAFTEIATMEPVRRIANLVYSPFRPRVAVHGATNVRSVTQFDETFDDLWERASVQWPCAVARKAAYLEWQFKRQPGKEFEVLAIYEAEKLAGYVVLFFRKDKRSRVPPKVAISDICYDMTARQTIIDDLVNAALKVALDRHAGSLVIDVLDERVEEQLQRLGFWRIKSSPGFMATAPIELQQVMYNQANWFLTRGDSDVSIFELPNR